MRATLLFPIFLWASGIAQQIVWVRTLPITYCNDIDVAVDSRNNVVVSAKPWIVKFSPDGESLWARMVNLPMSPSGAPTQYVACDPDDNIIAATSPSETSWAVVKFTPTGESLWTWDTLISPRPALYGLSEITTNSGGEIFVTGSQSGTYESRWLTFQITPDGHTGWVRTFSSGWGPDGAWGVCADRSDNVVVGGCRGIYPRPRQWFPQLIKYSKNGEVLVQVVYDPYPFPANLNGYKPGTDPDGNLILPGGGTISDTYNLYPQHWYGAFLLKYDPVGNLLWGWFSDTAAEGNYGFYSCVTDTAGNIYAAGSKVRNNRRVIILRRFSPYGDTAWTFYYEVGEVVVGAPAPVSLAIDRDGDIVIVAPVPGNYLAPSPRAYVVKVTPRSGVAEATPFPVVSDFSSPTIINRARPTNMHLSPDAHLELYDKTGRLLQRLRGEKGISFSKPGIYFLRISSGFNQRMVKLVVVN